VSLFVHGLVDSNLKKGWFESSFQKWWLQAATCLCLYLIRTPVPCVIREFLFCLQNNLLTFVWCKGTKSITLLNKILLLKTQNICVESDNPKWIQVLWCRVQCKIIQSKTQSFWTWYLRLRVKHWTSKLVSRQSLFTETDATARVTNFFQRVDALKVTDGNRWFVCNYTPSLRAPFSGARAQSVGRIRRGAAPGEGVWGGPQAVRPFGRAQVLSLRRARTRRNDFRGHYADRPGRWRQGQWTFYALGGEDVKVQTKIE